MGDDPVHADLVTLIIGRGIFVAPSDSLAMLAANAHLAPAYRDGIGFVLMIAMLLLRPHGIFGKSVRV